MSITIRYKTFTKSRMIDMALTKLKKAGIYTAFAAGAAVIAAPAIADDMQQVSVSSNDHAYFTSHGEAGTAARQYARENDAIGVVLHYGTGDGLPPEKFGELFKRAIEKRGEKAEFFVVTMNSAGMAMTFEMKHSGRGPLSVKEAASQLDDIIAEKKRMDALENLVADRGSYTTPSFK